MYLSSQTIDPETEFFGRTNRSARTGKARFKAAKKRNNPTKRRRLSVQGPNYSKYRGVRAARRNAAIRDRRTAQTQLHLACTGRGQTDVIGSPRRPIQAI